MDNPVWEWIAKMQFDAFVANRKLGGPDARNAGPCWSFVRYGQTSTHLPDGRTIYIGGEHEDYYDPNFNIYNDVVVQLPDGSLKFYGYPPSIFPPTDFHSATQVGGRLVLIGRLGGKGDGTLCTTPVVVLDLDTFAIEPMITKGEAPGWIHQHQAEMVDSGAGIRISGGSVYRGDALPIVENLDEWRLCLSSGIWERLTIRPCQHWILAREDGDDFHLLAYKMAIIEQTLNSESKNRSSALGGELGVEPDLDLFMTLFCPSIPHVSLPAREGDCEIHRIIIEGVQIRFGDQGKWIIISIEGELPSLSVDFLVGEICSKLAKLENIPISSFAL
jgi:hypothetical protein